MTTVGTDQLAAEAGISPQVARELARRKIFVRVAPGRFDREASMAAYLEHLRRASTGKRGGGKAFVATGEEPNERVRLARLQGDALERKNAIEAGKLVVAAEIEAEWTAIVVACRNAVLASPSRIQSDLPHLTAHDVATIDRHLREALTLLGASSS